MPVKIEISHKTIFFIFGFLIIIWFIWLIRDIIFVLYLSFILMSALRPIVEKLESLKLPRLLSAIIVYFLFLSLFGLIFGIIFPPLINQTTKFLEKLPEFFEKIIPFLPQNFEFLGEQLTPVGGNLVKITLGFISNIITLVTFLVLSFYFLLERKNLEETFTSFFGETKGKRIIKIIWKVEDRLGAWIRGQVILMFIIGIVSFLGLIALGVDYALPLALIAGALEIVPVVGPIISAIPAVLVALATSPILALTVIALYFIIQQLENNLIVPTVIKKTVGLPPLITLIALLIGGKLAGIFGAFLAVPTVLILQIVASELEEEQK